MTYATQSDMVARFGLTELVQLTDDADTGEIGARLAVALSDANQVINGYASGIYALPLSPVPDLVTRWACDIARYFLHRDAVPELVAQNYKDAKAGLKDVAKGDLTLECDGVEAPLAEGGQDDDLATFDVGERVMNDGPWS